MTGTEILRKIENSDTNVSFLASMKYENKW